MRKAFILIFILIVVGFLSLIDAVIYNAVSLIFSITASSQLFLLGIGLGLLSGSFIAATIIGSYFYNWFSRAYYTLSAVWIGTSVYLFFASVIYGLVVSLSGQSLNVLGLTLILITVIVSVYGILHARRISIKEISVSLPYLPISWQGKKAVWISDLHLGQFHGPSFARRIVEKVNSLPHDIVFIGGDLYDGTGTPDIVELAVPLNKLRAPLGSYFITGNHEEFGKSDKFIAAVTSTGVRVLQDKMVEIDGLQLIGVDYHNASNAERFKAILSKLEIDREKTSILLKHEPKDLDVAQKAGISLQISGHTHRAQLYPLEYIARLTYKGFVYGLKYFKDMQIYTSSGTGTWGPPMRVGTDCEIVVLTFMNKIS